MDKTKLLEMMKQKKALEAQLKTLRESKSKTKTPVKESLSYLIESELEKAELVLAAKGIVDKIGKMAEDLAKVEGDDIMPMLDALKAAYGPESAQAFRNIAGQKLRTAIDSLSASKDAISTEVAKLEGIVNGQQTNDMANYDDGSSDPAAGLGSLDATPPADDMSGMGDMGAEDSTTDFEKDTSLGDLPLDSADQNPAGRARKESVSPKAKPLKEDEKSLFSKKVAAPAMTSPKAKEGTMPSKTATLPKNEKQTAAIDNPRKNSSQKPVAPFFSKKTKSEVTENAKFQTKMSPSTHDLEIDEVPGFEGIDHDTLRRAANAAILSHKVGVDRAVPFKVDGYRFTAKLIHNDHYDEGQSIDVRLLHEGASKKKSSIKVTSLEESVVKIFKMVTREGHTPLVAAKAIAEKFDMTLRQVVDILKEDADAVVEDKLVSKNKDEKKSEKKDDKKLDEISKEKVGNYVKKAANDVSWKRHKVGTLEINSKGPKDVNDREDTAIKAKNRSGHIDKAVDKSTGKAKVPATDKKVTEGQKSVIDLKPGDWIGSKDGGRRVVEVTHGSRDGTTKVYYDFGNGGEPATSIYHNNWEDGSPMTVKIIDKVSEHYGNYVNTLFSKVEGTKGPSIPKDMEGKKGSKLPEKEVEEDYQNGSGSFQNSGNSGSGSVPTTAAPTTATTAPASAPAPKAPNTAPQANMGTADQQKVAAMTNKVKATPNLKADNVEQAVAKNISSVGKTSNDVPEMTNMVRDQLTKDGTIKENKRVVRKTK